MSARPSGQGFSSYDISLLPLFSPNSRVKAPVPGLWLELVLWINEAYFWNLSQVWKSIVSWLWETISVEKPCLKINKRLIGFLWPSHSSCNTSWKSYMHMNQKHALQVISARCTGQMRSQFCPDPTSEELLRYSAKLHWGVPILEINSLGIVWIIFSLTLKEAAKSIVDLGLRSRYGPEDDSRSHRMLRLCQAKCIYLLCCGMHRRAPWTLFSSCCHHGLNLWASLAFL